jgi:hypothetical protein
MTDIDPAANANRDLDQTTDLQRDILRSLDEARRDAGTQPAGDERRSGTDQSRGPDGGTTGGTAIGNGPGISTDGRS